LLILRKKFKEIRWYFLIWLALFISGLFFLAVRQDLFALVWRSVFITGIAIQYKILKELEDIGKKLVMIILNFDRPGNIYSFSPRILIPNLNGSYSNMSAPYQEN